MKTFFRWQGGKSRVSEWILGYMTPHDCYVEAFCGAGAIYFAKEPAKTEVINDINNELITLFRVIKCHPDEFYRQFKHSLSSRKEFMDERYKNPSSLTDIQRAYRFFYMQQLCFGGKANGTSFGTSTTGMPGLNIFRLEQQVSDVHHRLSRTYIENLDWHELVKKYDRKHTLHYLDPPYLNTAGYGMEFGINEYEKMADFAKNSLGQVIISVNDIKEMREIFKGLEMHSKPIKYSMGKGNVKKVSRELLVINK